MMNNNNTGKDNSLIYNYDYHDDNHMPELMDCLNDDDVNKHIWITMINGNTKCYRCNIDYNDFLNHQMRKDD